MQLSNIYDLILISLATLGNKFTKLTRSVY